MNTDQKPIKIPQKHSNLQNPPKTQEQEEPLSPYYLQPKQKQSKNYLKQTLSQQPINPQSPTKNTQNTIQTNPDSISLPLKTKESANLSTGTTLLTSPQSFPVQQFQFKIQQQQQQLQQQQQNEHQQYQQQNQQQNSPQKRSNNIIISSENCQNQKLHQRNSIKDLKKLKQSEFIQQNLEKDLQPSHNLTQEEDKSPFKNSFKKHRKICKSSNKEFNEEFTQNYKLNTLQQQQFKDPNPNTNMKQLYQFNKSHSNFSDFQTHQKFISKQKQDIKQQQQQQHQQQQQNISPQLQIFSRSFIKQNKSPKNQQQLYQEPNTQKSQTSSIFKNSIIQNQLQQQINPKNSFELLKNELYYSHQHQQQQQINLNTQTDEHLDSFTNTRQDTETLNQHEDYKSLQKDINKIKNGLYIKKLNLKNTQFLTDRNFSLNNKFSSTQQDFPLNPLKQDTEQTQTHFPLNLTSKNNTLYNEDNPHQFVDLKTMSLSQTNGTVYKKRLKNLYQSQSNFKKGNLTTSRTNLRQKSQPKNLSPIKGITLDQLKGQDIIMNDPQQQHHINLNRNTLSVHQNDHITEAKLSKVQSHQKLPEFIDENQEFHNFQSVQHQNPQQIDSQNHHNQNQNQQSLFNSVEDTQNQNQKSQQNQNQNLNKLQKQKPMEMLKLLIKQKKKKQMDLFSHNDINCKQIKDIQGFQIKQDSQALKKPKKSIIDITQNINQNPLYQCPTTSRCDQKEQNLIKKKQKYTKNLSMSIVYDHTNYNPQNMLSSQQSTNQKVDNMQDSFNNNNGNSNRNIQQRQKQRIHLPNSDSKLKSKPSQQKLSLNQQCFKVKQLRALIQPQSNKQQQTNNSSIQKHLNKI